MSKIYKYNPFFLWFKDAKMEKKFNLSRFKEDLNALRFVIILGTALSIVFIFVDVIRYESDLISISFRGGMALILMILGALTFLFQKKNTNSLSTWGS